MNNEDDSRKRTAERDGRFRLLAALWGFATEARDTPHAPVTGRRAPAPGRVRDCHRKAISEFVQVKAAGGAAALGSVSTCGSPWVCPVCSPKVAARRQVEVQDAIRAWQGKGGSVVLVTLTLSHSREHALSDSWDAITAGWSAVRNGRGWQADKTAFGIRGYVRVVEVTRSDANGWHPHVHALLFVDRRFRGAHDAELLRDSIYGRWSTKLAELGYKTLDFDQDGRAVAVDVRTADQLPADYLADYFAKFGYTPKVEGGSGSLAVEVARGDKKSGRKGSRTPWQILEGAADGSAADLLLWHEWETTAHGRRQYAWAQGFRESLDLDVMCADRDAVDAEDAVLDVVALLRGRVYADLVKNLRQTRKLPGASRLSIMLDKAATLDPERFRDWLTRARIDHVAPGDVALVDVLDPVTGELRTVDGAAAAGTADRFAPAPVPGRRHVTWNRRDQIHRERVASVRLRDTSPAPAERPWEDTDYSDAVGPQRWQPPAPAPAPAPARHGSADAEHRAARLRRLYGV